MVRRLQSNKCGWASEIEETLAAPQQLRRGCPQQSGGGSGDLHVRLPGELGQTFVVLRELERERLEIIVVVLYLQRIHCELNNERPVCSDDGHHSRTSNVA